MPETRWVISVLRALLALMFALLLMVELLSFPGKFNYLASHDPDFTPLHWGLLVLIEAGLVCAQVVIVCGWRLLTMVRSDTVFSKDAVRWIDAAIRATAIAWLMFLALVMFVFANADDPGVGVMTMLVFLPLSIFALSSVVMRALLVRAIELQHGIK